MSHTLIGSLLSQIHKLLVRPFTQSEGFGQQTGFNPNSCYLCLCVALPGVASSLGPFPLPLRSSTHCCACATVFCYIFHTKLHPLPYPYVEDYTNQEYKTFFEIDSNNNLTCRTLLGYYFSDVAVSNCTVRQKGMIYQKGPFVPAYLNTVSKWFCIESGFKPPPGSGLQTGS